MTSQLIGLTVAAAAGGSDKDQAIAGWVASQATKFNYLEHEERVAFAKAMGGCGSDDECSREKWEQGKFDEDSTGNMEYAKDISGSQRAKMARDRIMDDLDTLVAMPCGNGTCERYKQLLVSRSLEAIGYLSDVIKDWAPAYDRIGLLAGAAMGGGGAKATLQIGEFASNSRIQKAIDYLVSAESKGSDEWAVSWTSREGVFSGNLGSYSGSTVTSNGNKISSPNDYSSELGENSWGQNEPVILANVNGGKNPYTELNAAIAEARGWNQALELGQIPISPPGKASAPGADFITFDPGSSSLVVWDAKYRGPGGSYPSTLSPAKIEAWQAEIVKAVQNMPAGENKAAAERALSTGKVIGRIFKWPQ